MSASPPTRVEREFRLLDLSQPYIINARSGAQALEWKAADKLVQRFEETLKTYHDGCLRAKRKLGAATPTSQLELDAIWKKHSKMVEKVDKLAGLRPLVESCYHDPRTLLSTANLQKWREACKLKDTGDKVVKELNAPYRLQVAREQDPELFEFIDDYLESRRQRGDVFWERARPFLPAPGNPSPVLNHQIISQLHNDWLEYDDDEEPLQDDLETRMGKEITADFLCCPEFVSIQASEELIDTEITELFNRSTEEIADENDEEEEGGEVEEEEWEDPADFSEDDESPDRTDHVWTEQDFQELRDQLGWPTPANLSEDLTHLNSQVVAQLQQVDSRCTICLQGLIEPTELARCHHKFCFECIVRWIDGASGSSAKTAKCPQCRKHCEFHDLKIYNVTGEVAAKEDVEPNELEAARRSKAPERALPMTVREQLMEIRRKMEAGERLTHRTQAMWMFEGSERGE